MEEWRSVGELVAIMTRPCVVEKTCDYTQKTDIIQCNINELHIIIDLAKHAKFGEHSGYQDNALRPFPGHYASVGSPGSCNINADFTI
jgi:hypothetical protein